jgi:pimeloyl-ACP methyl ester carboxylesterase
MSWRSLLSCIVVLECACRSAAIPAAQRYPAGTAFRAQYRTVDGTRLRLIDSTGGGGRGRGGTPVVFIHGIGASLYAWRHQLNPLVAAGYRVVAFDNRGFGFSDKPAHGYRNADYAHLLVSLLDSLGIASAVLVGHSMGGAIAAEVAIAHPDRVRGLVLIDAAGYGVRWPGVIKLARLPFIGPIATTFRGRWITGRILRSTFADPAKVVEADVDQYYAPVADPDYGRALRGVLREFRFDTLSGGRLATVQAPTLILWGDADRWISIRDGSRFARELPRSEFVVVQHAGHNAPEEAPDQVNQLLLGFLKEGLSRIPENVAWYSPVAPKPTARPVAAPDEGP